jgi:hypothetical protein
MEDKLYTIEKDRFLLARTFQIFIFLKGGFSISEVAEVVVQMYF